MVTEYTFNKTEITKMYAFDSYIRNHLQAKLAYYRYTDPELLIATNEALDTNDFQALETFVNEYADPSVFLMLNTTNTDITSSKTTNSATPVIVKTFIYASNTQNGNGVFNSLKTVVEYHTDDVSQFLGETSGTCTFQLYCHTRQFLMEEVQVDISEIVTAFATKASNNESGPCSMYKTLMIEGLRNQVANYDCIWHIKMGVSNENMNTTLHSIQSLYYDVM